MISTAISAISLFAKSRRTPILIVLAIAGIGLLIYLYFDKSSTLKVRTDERDGARDSLGKALVHVGRLQVDSTKLLNAYLTTDNIRLKRENEAEQAKSDAATAQASLDQANQQHYQYVQSMSAVQKKQAADLGTLREKLGNLPTTTSDETVNGIIASMSGKIANQDTVITKLTYSNGVLTAENKTLREDKLQLQSEKSDLERELNGDRNTFATYIENIPKPALNIGYGKRVKRAANDIRAGRVKRN